jgi:hypothetical protein
MTAALLLSNTDTGLDAGTDTDTDLHRAARQLRMDFGWSSVVRGGVLQVELDEDLSAIELDRDLAVDVLARLREHGMGCPVVTVPGDRNRCVLFFRQDTGAPFPASVTVLPAGRTVVVPPSVNRPGGVHWLSSPWTERVDLPPARVLAATVVH